MIISLDGVQVRLGEDGWAARFTVEQGQITGFPRCLQCALSLPKVLYATTLLSPVIPGLTRNPGGYGSNIDLDSGSEAGGEVLKSAPNVDAEIKALEEKYDDDTESIITNERYQ